MNSFAYSKFNLNLVGIVNRENVRSIKDNISEDFRVIREAKK